MYDEPGGVTSIHMETVKLFVIESRLLRMKLFTMRLVVKLLIPLKVYTVSPIQVLLFGVGPPEVAPWKRL